MVIFSKYYGHISITSSILQTYNFSRVMELYTLSFINFTWTTIAQIALYHVHLRKDYILTKTFSYRIKGKSL